VLPDAELHLPVEGGRDYAPRDYDDKLRGPVRLREALGNSLNVPAVWTAEQVGVDALLQRLRELGFDTLVEGASYYGPGLALGDGEVTLLELTAAYAPFANGGELVAPRLLLSRRRAGGGAEAFGTAPAKRVLRADLAALVSDMLSDDAARAAGFGRDSALNLPFPVAAKTGTSKGYRDNWAVGYTREVTVGVWVGNFDGTPLRDASGITAAGPAFHELMLAAMRGRVPAPLVERSGLTEAEVCASSGKLPGVACPHRVREHFAAGTAPREACDLHVRVRVDAEGHEQHPRCGGRELTLERYPLELRAWAERAGRPLLERLPRGGRVQLHAPTELRVTFPHDGQRFAIDPDGPRRQEIVLGSTASSERVRFVIDGAPSAAQRAPFRHAFRLSPGPHRVQVQTGEAQSEPVAFEVY